jgi:hypothetical protein
MSLGIDTLSLFILFILQIKISIMNSKLLLLLRLVVLVLSQLITKVNERERDEKL